MHDSQSGASEHLQKLEALFSGNGTAEPTTTPKKTMTRIRDERPVFANPRKSLGRAPSEFRLRLERLRIAREPKDIQQATDQFLKFHQLPDDAEILVKVLQHPAEKVLREAMGQISSLLMQGRLETTVLVEDRLQQLNKRELESGTQSYVEGLLQQIASQTN